MKIKEITLFTTDIQKQKQFYKDVLEFELIFDSCEKIVLKTGKSILSFEYKLQAKPTHLAFNIPFNSIDSALSWLKQRTSILPFQNQQIVRFDSWKAEAVYFYDADHNIIEFIARERLGIKNERPFSPCEIISIGEIAIATDAIEPVYKQINSLHPIPVFDGDFSRFCALGNDDGLFIIIDKNKKSWVPTMEKAFTSDFIIKGTYNFIFEKGKIKELL